MKPTDKQLARFEEDVLWVRKDSPTQGNTRVTKQATQIALKLLDRANAVRNHVQSLVSKRTEVIVKITGSNASMTGLARSVNFISRSVLAGFLCLLRRWYRRKRACPSRHSLEMFLPHPLFQLAGRMQRSTWSSLFDANPFLIDKRSPLCQTLKRRSL